MNGRLEKGWQSRHVGVVFLGRTEPMEKNYRLAYTGPMYRRDTQRHTVNEQFELFPLDVDHGCSQYSQVMVRSSDGPAYTTRHILRFRI
jgi:hypothetical protein